jgi:hypothetical protein
MTVGPLGSCDPPGASVRADARASPHADRRRARSRAREPDPALAAEAEAATRASAGAPLRRALARIAGRLVATRAWERLGYARLADYAGERAGISARQIQELARADAALARLPAIEAAFLAGRISWSKARDLTRAATPEDEAVWLEAAERLTARALEREVRAVDRRALTAVEVRAAPDVGPLEIDEDGYVVDEDRAAVQLRVSVAVRGKWWRARRLAQRVAGLPLSHGECAEAVAAEVLSAIALDGAGAETVVIDDSPAARARAAHARAEPDRAEALAAARPSPPAACAGPESSPRFLAALVRGLDAADAFELDRRLRAGARLEQRWLAELAPRVLDAARGRAHRRLGFGDLGDWARERLGMSPRKAQALLRLERAGEVCPGLRAAFRAGRLSWRQAHVLVPLLLLDESLPHRTAWIERAARISLRRLEDEVDFALAHGVLEPHACARAMAATEEGCGRPDGAGPTDPFASDAATAPQPEAGPRPHACARSMRPARSSERERLFFVTPRAVARLFRATLATVQRRIERAAGRAASESEALEAMLDHVLATWQALARLHPREHRVFERDGWRCAVPGCRGQRELHAHHLWWRSAGGPDDDWNLVTLCAWHHLRAVHLHTVRVLGRAPHGLVFELGVRTGAAPLARYGPGEVLMPA